jgi:phenylpropionate dioxygenase-like ring-hydroxylating dioxygenase large terminal subunit
VGAGQGPDGRRLTVVGIPNGRNGEAADRAALLAASGVRVHDILASDAVPPPPALLEDGVVPLYAEEVPVARYTSPEWHQLEIEHLWRRVWQVACRVEELAAVGDHVVYEIGDDSLIVVRTAADEIRAYHNACLHRGTQLRSEAGNVNCFRCPFHGFTWNLDGTLSNIPSPWDFPGVDFSQYCLPEARVDTWGGFVFVNFDLDCEPLDEYLEILPAHLAGFRLEERYKAVHVSQVVPCNWKVGLEAFFEGYHVNFTHPQSVKAFDSAVKYDVWPGVRHTSRLIQLGAMASPHVRAQVSEEEILSRMQHGLPDGMRRTLSDGELARPVVAEIFRQVLSVMHRTDLSGLSDSETIDQIQYFFFPNMIPWPGAGAPLVYRFRPWMNDPNQCLMEVWYLHPRPDGDERPAPAQEIRLEPGAPWAGVPELGPYGPIFDQDMPNLARVQKGLRATRRPTVTFSAYQESRIRHFHHVLGEYVDPKGEWVEPAER